MNFDSWQFWDGECDKNKILQNELKSASIFAKNELYSVRLMVDL